ncbi:hypothetical protein [Actinomadura harenae]|uniref:hypothetical protein n=1 Tax=Actinomadura harenae TaxID=2483351 RepID=UPI00131597F4|nr:hypothetical protein [Actinomadura harenae]
MGTRDNRVRRRVLFQSIAMRRVEDYAVLPTPQVQPPPEGMNGTAKAISIHGE